MEIDSSSLKKTARLAGLLYLLLVITGVYGIMYIPSQIIVAGDSVATAKNMISNEVLFRTGILNDIISKTSNWIYKPFAFFGKNWEVLSKYIFYIHKIHVSNS